MTQVKSQDSKKTDTKEVKAFARGIHISPRKVRLVARILKNLPVAEALLQLDFIPQKATLPLKKLINSAIANASHNFQIVAEKLYIKSITVDGGRVFFRYQPRAQGRAMPVRKRTSHLNLILGVRATPLKPKRRFFAPSKKIETKVEEKAVPSTPKAEEKKSRFAFWRRKKTEDTSQIPPKEDFQGKRYTGFDRRGNM